MTCENMNSTDKHTTYIEPWTEAELLSFLLWDIKQTGDVPRRAHERYTHLLRLVSPVTPYTPAATLGHLESVTGIQHIRIDCCVNSCMAFTESNTAESCLYCGQPRFKQSPKPMERPSRGTTSRSKGKRSNRTTSHLRGEPRATFDYIPVTHRLRLQYASADRAKAMTSYSHQYQQREPDDASAERMMTDVWDGDLIKQLQQRHILDRETDLCFTFSTDGVKVFKTRSAFHIWPLFLINNNLPIDQRYKKENVLLLGVIPGPNQPKDLDSFLRPMIDEFKVLATGIPQVYNGYTKQYFTLRAFIPFVCADSKGRETLMGVTGLNSYRYCFYCNAWGVHSGGRGGHIYCPFKLPHDLSSEARQNPKISMFEERDVLTEPLDLRTDDMYRRQAWHVFDQADTHSGDVGIKRLTVWAELESIVFPWSFVLDSMHLFWENILPFLFNFWRGKILNDSPNGTDDKFRLSEDAFNVTPEQWLKIGEGMKESCANFPTAWGDAPRDIVKHCQHMTAAEWRNFGLLFAPVVLLDVLPSEYYDAFISLVEGIEQSTSSIAFDKIDNSIRHPMNAFLQHFQDHYYRLEHARLSACRSQVHMLAHVADTVQWIGPLSTCAQWCCERLCGDLVRSIKNRVSANRTVSLEVIRREQTYHLPFLARCDTSQKALQTLLDNPSDGSQSTTTLDAILTGVNNLRQTATTRRLATTNRVQTSLRCTTAPLFHETPFIAPDFPPQAGIKTHRLTTNDRQLILNFCLTGGDGYHALAGFPITLRNIPTIANTHKKCQAQDGSVVHSIADAPPNMTRSCSNIEYVSQNITAVASDEDQTSRHYGRLHRLLSVDLQGLPVPTLHLAIIRRYCTIKAGRCMKVQSEGLQIVIAAQNISCLMGLVVNGISGETYVVEKDSALLWDA
jgi:hypothetical protein